MRSITTFDLQYAHRFYGFKGEAQYLHGHTGVLTIEVEDSINMGVNMVYPCNEIQKVAWDVLKNFDHSLILREDDPLLPAILDVYEKQGIKNGHPQRRGFQDRTCHSLSRLSSCGDQGDHDRGRHDKDCIRPAEGQAKHRQDYIHQWRECSICRVLRP